MRTVFVSDLHAAVKLPGAKMVDGGVSSDRLSDVLGVLGRIAQWSEQNKVTNVVIAGDLFDAQKPDGPTLVHTSRALAELAQVAPVYLLPGNHDAVDRDGRLYTLQLYRELKVPGIRVLGHGAVELANGAILHAVPWLPDDRALKRIRKRSEGVDPDSTNVLVFHQGVLGALWDSGMVSDDGLDPDELGVFDHAVSGHYHRAQKFGSNGRYLGSPLDLRFGDEEQEVRGFSVFDWNSKHWKLIDSEAPRFQTVRVNADDGFSTEFGWGDRVLYGRIIVEGSAKAIGGCLEELRTLARYAEEDGLRVCKVDARPTREVRARMEITPTLSLGEMVRRFATERAPEGVSPDRLAELGLRLMGDP